MNTDVGFCWTFVFGDMVIFRKVFGFKEIYINLFRRCLPIANLFYTLPFEYSRTFGNEYHSLTPYALKRVSLYFILTWYIENSLFYQITVEMSFTVSLGVG